MFPQEFAKLYHDLKLYILCHGSHIQEYSGREKVHEICYVPFGSDLIVDHESVLHFSKYRVSIINTKLL